MNYKFTIESSDNEKTRKQYLVQFRLFLYKIGTFHFKNTNKNI